MKLDLSLTNPSKWYIPIVNDTSGIKCDNPGCGYREENVPLNRHIEYLGRKCPKCNGELPLMSEKDFQTLKIVNWLFSWKIIRFANWLGTVFGIKKTKYRMGMDGKGNLEIEKIDLIEQV